MLIRFWYHVKSPKPELYPNLLARFLAIGFMENTGIDNSQVSVQLWPADHLRLALTIWEAVLDGSLFFVFMAATICVRSYVEEKRTPDSTSEAVASQRIKKD